MSVAMLSAAALLFIAAQTGFVDGPRVFKNETYLTKLLHNFTVFVLQREFFKQGMPFFVLPIRV